MSEEEFRTLTPRRFHALHERFCKAIDHSDLALGIVAAAVANFSICKDHDKEPLQPWDFMPWLEKPEQTPEQMREFILAFRAAREKAAQA